MLGCYLILIPNSLWSPAEDASPPCSTFHREKEPPGAVTAF